MAGSLDNLTAVVVALRGYKHPPGAASSPAEPRRTWLQRCGTELSRSRGAGADALAVPLAGLRSLSWDAHCLDPETPWVAAF